jgi:hypothetical protein
MPVSYVDSVNSTLTQTQFGITLLLGCLVLASQTGSKPDEVLGGVGVQTFISNCEITYSGLKGTSLAPRNL